MMTISQRIVLMIRFMKRNRTMAGQAMAAASFWINVMKYPLQRTRQQTQTDSDRAILTDFGAR
ncbi:MULTISPECIES: hypothetical protein [unclassified Mesorhizobium]|uniref:hypothetical protein n=1 Tax=unclassified Mesorhizobium TaxID=325217 RepID=UPI0015E2F5DF|nr:MULTISPECIES: hypothetical protein [unclassified Mesorhizobium]MCA0002620.1 hypothetical protein [Mesorhizobium sp. B264B2A]MCA0005848.1 hypothetical protein [Mesorhizobium sp. B264B1B]MCA0019217.1 hypothetical protein [Mesorhizobium sp. B264B1A]